jgi:nicotinate-nucleotide pyrophosphorylase (carboxylating)
MKDFVDRVLSEDIGRGDLSALLVSDDDATSKIITKEDGVLAGERYAQALADELGCCVCWKKNDGDELKKGDLIAIVKGKASSILTLERSMLNTLQHASGIATLTRQYCTVLKESGVVLLDTRKTRPGLRVFEKYATRIGGAVNHRMGLDDAVMIKDTHWAHIGSLKSAIEKAKSVIPFTTMIEVECETVKQAQEAMQAGAHIVMCDNMTHEQIKEVVKLRNLLSPATKIEASGNITLATILEIAQTGIDAISTGSMIHQAVWLDFSMKMDLAHG